MNRGIFSYNGHVTTDEMWKQVGRLLKEHREERGITQVAVHEQTGVDMKTIRSIDAGEVSNLQKLQAYTEALGLTLVSVLTTVLDRSKVPLTPEARQLLERFGRISIHARQALLLSALAYPDVSEEWPDGHPPPHGLPGRGRHKR